ncbi:MAG TPA: hypothetical protein PLC99_13405 [Verrucomicrobiota bacterium]|nr:hypothetical protein [Verrucomicrobiota bacterium]
MSKNTCFHAKENKKRKDEAWFRHEMLLSQSSRVFKGVSFDEPKVIRYFLLPPEGPAELVVKSQVVSMKILSHPPRVEVEKLWRQSTPVMDNPNAREWLEAQGINAVRAEDYNLVRVIPSSGVFPEWARTGNHSWKRNHHLAARLYDHNGIPRSICAQTTPPQGGLPGVETPQGYSSSGLVLADALTRLLLAGKVTGDGRPAAELVRKVGLEILVGFVPFLRRTCTFSDADELAPAVLGLLRESWNEQLSRRVPPGFSAYRNASEDGMLLKWR